MPRCRVVIPHVDRLALDEDDWIEVKHELNTGEQRRMFAAMRTRTDDGRIEVDASRIHLSRALAYIVAWSLIDPAGRPLPLTADALDELQSETSRAIREAIDAHEAAVDAEIEAQKKTRLSGATRSDPTLQSVG
jgi:hypothetical protein